MAKVSSNSIPNIEADWGLDLKNNLPYSGKAVQEFIKKQLSTLSDNVTQTFGYSEFVDGNLLLYNKKGGTLLQTITLSGSSYSISIKTNVGSLFTVLNSDNSFYLELTPSTLESTLGSSDKVEYVEDYIYKLEIKDGHDSYIDITPDNNVIKYGKTASIDIRKYLSIGTNEIQVTVTGVLSQKSMYLTLNAVLTNLKLEVDHEWNNAWIEDSDYLITGIKLSGNVKKILKATITDSENVVKEVSPKIYSASENHNTQPTSLSLRGYEPENTGIVKVEIWLESEDGISTKSYIYNLMYIKKEDMLNTSLICVNEVIDKVKNTENNTILKYATYGMTEINTAVTLYYEDIVETLPITQSSVETEKIRSLDLKINVDTEDQDNLYIKINLYKTYPEEYEVTLPIDNSMSFSAAPNPFFYLNPSLGDNNSKDKELIINSAKNKEENIEGTYVGEWNNFTFADDAWIKDDSNNAKALVVKAGATLKIPNLKPFYGGSTSKTIEFMYKVKSVADYNTPILTMMSTETVTDNTVGIILYPTKIVVLANDARNTLFQQLPLSENRTIHVCVVIQRKFADNVARNLVRVYINGCENFTFNINASSSFFEDGGVNYVKIGQESSDFYLYLLRMYNTALSSTSVLKNYLNAHIDTMETTKQGIREDNNILDGGVIYKMCKDAGFNVMTIQTVNDVPIPSYNNQNTVTADFTLEYNEHPEWNVTIKNVSTDGQGTTSKSYYRWNLRGKGVKNDSTKPDTEWVYASGSAEKSKDGYMAGYGLNPKVGKFTFKKNIASQPQGHKMGATSLYNDLYMLTMGGVENVVREEVLPSDKCRVAVYQYPFVGFQKFSNGTYEFIGLYTGGPDKTDKKTFGYNETSKYPNLMMIEGPNHQPYLTRFLVPWTDEVFYDTSTETLSIGTVNNKQEGWDADIVGDFDTKEDKDAIFSLYKKEFKPAYDAIVYNSLYLASIEDTSYDSLEAINLNVKKFQNESTTINVSYNIEGESFNKDFTFNNNLLTLYDKDYNLIYYRYSTGKYEVLDKSVHNMLEYLGFNPEDTPSTSELIAARINNWKSEVGKYVNLGEAYFHQVFCEFIGATDNDAKNTYWRKFKELSMGGKWGFNQDDLDTIFQTDNNGQDTKSYYIEPDDTNSEGVEIFQGRTSAFWFALRNNCQKELKEKMRSFIESANNLARSLNIQDTTIHGSIFNLLSYYFWEKSSKYFSATLYNEDTDWGYITPWFIDPKKEYNSVPPLTQIHGDHYETERAWVEKRIAYIFSKYQIAAFTGQNDDGYGVLELTSKGSFTFDIIPAISMYPRVSEGGTESNASSRTIERETYHLTVGGSSNTTSYIKGLHWMSELGDLSKLELSTRSDGGIVTMSVIADRLRRLKVGDDILENVKFNAEELKITGLALEELNAKNVTSLKNSLDLTECPRLSVVDITNTKIPTVSFPEGGRLTSIKLPSTLQVLTLDKLNLLSELVIPENNIIKSVYLNNCNKLNAIQLLTSLMNAENSVLKYVGLIWSNTLTLKDSSFISMLYTLGTAKNEDGSYKYRYATYTKGQLLTDDNKAPNIQGKIYIDNYVYEDEINELRKIFGTLFIEYNPNKLHIKFEDPEFQKLIVKTPAEGGYGDGIGVTQEQLDDVKTFSGSKFQNTTITDLSDLYKFRNVTTIQTQAFFNNPYLKNVIIPNTITSLNLRSFANNDVLESIVLSKNMKTISYGAFGWEGRTVNENKLTSVVFPDNIQTIEYGAFAHQKALKKIVLGKGVLTIDGTAFYNNTALQDVYIDSVNHWLQISKPPIGKTLYLGTIDEITEDKGIYGTITVDYNWDKLEGTGEYEGQGTRVKVTLPMVNEALQDESITEIKQYACKNMTQLEGGLVIPDNITSIGNDAFSGCSGLKSVEIGNSVTSIGDSAFTSFNIEGDLIIPESVRDIYQMAFTGNATRLIIPNLSGIETITQPNNWPFAQGEFDEIHIDSINKLSLSNCIKSKKQGWDLYVNGQKLESLVVPFKGNNTLFSNYSYSNIKSAIVEEGFTRTSDGPFESSNIEHLDYPSTMTNIVWFRDMNKLKTCIIRAVTPPSCSIMGNHPNCTLYVPDASVGAYRGAIGWSVFADRIKPLSEYVES